MKNVNQEGLNELSQEELTQIDGGQSGLGKLAMMVDNVCESLWGGRPFQKYENL